MTRKKNVISPSFTQWRRSAEIPPPPIRIESFVVHNDWYESDHGEFAHRSAAIVAASRKIALPVSVLRKSRTGAPRFRAQAVRPVKASARPGRELATSTLILLSGYDRCHARDSGGPSSPAGAARLELCRRRAAPAPHHHPGAKAHGRAGVRAAHRYVPAGPGHGHSRRAAHRRAGGRDLLPWGLPLWLVARLGAVPAHPQAAARERDSPAWRGAGGDGAWSRRADRHQDGPGPAGSARGIRAALRPGVGARLPRPRGDVRPHRGGSHVHVPDGSGHPQLNAWTTARTPSSPRNAGGQSSVRSYTPCQRSV